MQITQERSLDKIVNKPVLTQRTVPTVQRCQKTVETPRAEFIDKTMFPPERQKDRRCSLSTRWETSLWTCKDRSLPPKWNRKTAEVPHVQLFDTMVDVPVVMQTQVSVIQAVQQTADFPHADVHVMEQRQAFIQKVQKSVDVARVIHQERVKPAGEGSSVRERVKQFDKDWRVKHTGTVEVPQALPDGSPQDG